MVLRSRLPLCVANAAGCRYGDDAVGAGAACAECSHPEPIVAARRAASVNRNADSAMACIPKSTRFRSDHCELLRASPKKQPFGHPSPPGCGSGASSLMGSHGLSPATLQRGGTVREGAGFPGAPVRGGNSIGIGFTRRRVGRRWSAGHTFRGFPLANTVSSSTTNRVEAWDHLSSSFVSWHRPTNIAKVPCCHLAASIGSDRDSEADFCRSPSPNHCPHSDLSSRAESGCCVVRSELGPGTAYLDIHSSLGLPPTGQRWTTERHCLMACEHRLWVIHDSRECSERRLR
jgi:hypothetical protein